MKTPKQENRNTNEEVLVKINGVLYPREKKDLYAAVDCIIVEDFKDSVEIKHMPEALSEGQNWHHSHSRMYIGGDAVNDDVYETVSFAVHRRYKYEDEFEEVDKERYELSAIEDVFNLI